VFEFYADFISYMLYDNCPLYIEDTFQNPQWMPETVVELNPIYGYIHMYIGAYIYMYVCVCIDTYSIFSYTYISLTYVWCSKLSAIITNDKME
jgi:hypothetical protein